MGGSIYQTKRELRVMCKDLSVLGGFASGHAHKYPSVQGIVLGLVYEPGTIQVTSQITFLREVAEEPDGLHEWRVVPSRNAFEST